MPIKCRKKQTSEKVSTPRTRIIVHIINTVKHIDAGEFPRLFKTLRRSAKIANIFHIRNLFREPNSRFAYCTISWIQIFFWHGFVPSTMLTLHHNNTIDTVRAARWIFRARAPTTPLLQINCPLCFCSVLTLNEHFSSVSVFWLCALCAIVAQRRVYFVQTITVAAVHCCLASAPPNAIVKNSLVAQHWKITTMEYKYHYGFIVWRIAFKKLLELSYKKMVLSVIALTNQIKYSKLHEHWSLQLSLVE